MAADIFPPGKLLKNGFKRQRIPNVIRSDMESGPAKQALRSTRNYLRFPVEYYFTKAEYEFFDIWVKDTINTIGTFDWIEPLNSTTVRAKIIGGDISDATPINPQLSHWVVKFIIEILDPLTVITTPASVIQWLGAENIEWLGTESLEW